MVEIIDELVKERRWGEGDPLPPSRLARWSDIPIIYKVGLVLKVSASSLCIQAC